MQQIIKKLFRSTLPVTPRPRLAIPPVDYVFITQYFKNGGAERVINNYISALHELHPALKISIIATDDDSGATWEEGIPKGVEFINLSPYTKTLPRYLRTRLLKYILRQASPETLHIVNSKVALDLVAKTKNPPFRTYLSLFNSDLSVSGRQRTYYKELAPAAKNITRIFTDNAVVITEATAATNLQKTLFSVHYQPTTARVQALHVLKKTGKIRILWASRLTLQKRPDILRDIARALPDDAFSISVYGTLEPPYTKKYFADTPIINYEGTFSSFSDLPTKIFDLFLYTSQADGLPNILLEATAAGLPIIAPDVGGVSEFISEETGFLIKRFDDTPAFVATLKNIAQNRTSPIAKIRAAQALLAKRHARSSFINSVKSDIII